MPPAIRTDIVDVYVFRQWPDETLSRAEPHVELLQLFRSKEPLRRTWQPVMGHIEEGESAVMSALRELGEEIGLTARSPAFVGIWALEQVHPFYIPELDAVMMSPRFAVEVQGPWRATLNGEHIAERWVPAHQAGRYFMWPGQRAAVREIIGSLLKPGPIRAEPLHIG
jgi:8-oxo-dGTP pyrophosphatase MutT (NUDIX family)